MASRAPRRRGMAVPTLRHLKRVVRLILPVAALVVVLAVLHGAGIPLSVPGVVIVFLLLFAVRVVAGWSRRGRRDHPVSPPRRPR